MGFAITELWNKEPFRVIDDVPAYDLPSEADDWLRLRASWWILVPLSLSVAVAVLGGLAAAAIVHVTFTSAGAAVPLWVLETLFFISFATLLFVGAIYLTRITAKLRRPLDQRERRAEWALKTESWETSWEAILGDNATVPSLVVEMSLPLKPKDDCPPMLKMLVFAKPPGLDSMQAVRATTKLAPAVHESLLFISPGSVPQNADHDTWSYFSIKHVTANFWEWVDTRREHWRFCSESWGVDVDPPCAYLDASLQVTPRSFLLERNLDTALGELGLAPVAPSNMMRDVSASPGVDTDSCIPPYMRANIVLRNGVTPQSLHQNQSALAARLHVGWLRFDVAPNHEEAVLHACPTHPDKTTFRQNFARTMPEEVVRLDFEYWMRSVGIVGSDGWAGPRVSCAGEARKIEVELPVGQSPDRVESVLAQLETAAQQRLSVSGAVRGSNKVTVNLLG